MLRKNIDLISLILWCVVIFVFSSIPSFSSGLKEDYFIRKIAHVSEYFVLVCMFYNFYKNKSRNELFNVVMSALASLAYAFTDEVHQTFIPGRSGNFFDISIDSIGILVGLLFIMVFLFRNHRLTIS